MFRLNCNYIGKGLRIACLLLLAGFLFCLSVQCSTGTVDLRGDVSRLNEVAAPSERIVFLGDSITEQRLYTRYVMDFFTLRYPGIPVSFRNAGWGGDTAPGGLQRLQRDVLSQNPTIVTICFGMNDGRYREFDQGLYDTYMMGMKGLVAELKKAKVQVVLLTAGCVDYRQNFDRTIYNKTLDRYGQGVMELAAAENLPCYNLHRLMFDIQSRVKAENPNATMIPDGIHPAPAGHVIMAYALLKALGCKDQASGLEIDAQSGNYRADRCIIKDMKAEGDKISFVRTDAALPLYLDKVAKVILEYFPFEEELNQYPLKVMGLRSGRWKITAQGIEVGAFSSDELSKGVNLASAAGPWQTMGEAVNKLSMEQENLYFTKWRNIEMLAVPPAVKPELDALAKKMDVLLNEAELNRIKATDNRTWNWTIERVNDESPAQR